MFKMFRKLGSLSFNSVEGRESMLVLAVSMIIGLLAVAATYAYGVAVNGAPVERFYMVGVFTTSFCILMLNRFWKFRHTKDGKVYLF